MNKKILAVAVAGALAAPGLAMAQASVTISGFVKVAVGQISNSGATGIGAAGVSPRTNAAGTAGLNTSETRLQDDGPTRIEFDMRDDLGGGMAGIAKLSLRPTIDGSSAVNIGYAGAGFGSSSGTAYVGLESKDWGTVRLGSIDQHYILGVDQGAVYAPTEMASGLMSYTYTATPVAGGRQSNAQSSETGASRTRNLVRYDSPNWNGFRVGVGYSFNTASGQESDLATSGRKGRSINLVPTYTADTWRVIFSYLDDKRDGGVTNGAIGLVSPTTGPFTQSATANDWKGFRLLGDIKLGDFTIGAGYDTMKINSINMVTGASTAVSNRHTWQAVGKYQFGKNIVTGMYSVAGNDKVQSGLVNGGLGGNTGAKNWSITYAYLFSPRTSIGVGYSVLKNDTFGAYTLSGESSGVVSCQPNCQNGYSSTNAEAFTGEKQSFVGVSLRQSF